jgi:hypothetical protein
MQTALAEIEASHGSVTGFLLGPARMTTDTLAALRELLLT